MATLTRKNKDFMLAMLEIYVERELEEMERCINRARKYMKEVTDLLRKSLAEKE